jgi:hypothetical protein
MGLFDSLFNPQALAGQGGLLGGVLPQVAPWQNQPAPQNVAPPAARASGTAMPPASAGAGPVSGNQPIPSFPSMQALLLQGPPGIADRLNAGLMGFANGGAPIPAIANLISGLATGERSDRQGVAQRQQHQVQAATYQALRAAGAPDATAQAAALDPQLLKAVVPQYLARHPAFGVIGTDGAGHKRYGFIDPYKRTTQPAQPTPVPAAAPGP